jgi:hypothetical protein
MVNCDHLINLKLCLFIVLITVYTQIQTQKKSFLSFSSAGVLYPFKYSQPVREGIQHRPCYKADSMVWYSDHSVAYPMAEPFGLERHWQAF